MINWIKYDPENPPEINTPHLIIDKEDEIYSAELNPGPVFGLSWWGRMGYIGNVTHYAHINLPGEDQADGL